MNERLSSEWQCNLTDRLVATLVGWATATRVADCLIEKNLPSPQNFDLVFFDVNLTKCALDYFEYSIPLEFPEVFPNSGCNYPDFSDERWKNSAFVTSGFKDLFIATIQESFSSGGAPFDVTFACEIVARTFAIRPDGQKDKSTLDFLQEIRGQKIKSFEERLNDGDDIWS